jgi:hypothetical protein
MPECCYRASTECYSGGFPLKTCGNDKQQIVAEALQKIVGVFSFSPHIILQRVTYCVFRLCAFFTQHATRNTSKPAGGEKFVTLTKI